ncbi:MAG: hypothetical protein IT210_03335 [Armatimonadetes bacterium]|nr:hypothetical protein [Armatimonadota bacterium]
MTLKECQQRIDAWIRAHGGYWGEFEILARMSEELGEVASDLQRMKGLRPRKAETDIEGELGDLLFILCAFANRVDIDLEGALIKTLAKYDRRDSAAWKGKTQAGETRPTP